MKVALQNLTKKFPNRGKKTDGDVIAVNNVSFEIPDGRLVGLLGPSGCGKSTTLFMICGLQKPSAGRIFFGDEDVTELPPEARGVGVVFQNYALYPHMTVRQNIMFPLQNRKGRDKLSKQELEERTREAARLVQMEELLDRKPSELSGGQQQRVAIARAMVKMPRVLLLDEPLSNLDARLRLQTREEIRRIQRETGITTVFVTHDQEEAMSISDQIVVMKEGVVQQMGKPQEVYDDPVNLFVARFLGTPPINLFEGQVRGGRLYIGADEVLDVSEVMSRSSINNQGKTAKQSDRESRSNRTDRSDITDQKVMVGIRPEGFIVDESGPLHCRLSGVEVMGRDTSIVSMHEASQSGSIRSIVDAASQVNTAVGEVHFSLKPDKVLLFDVETEMRIYGTK